MAARHLGPFEILEKIGQGGMGVVWKARHTRLNRVVALKILAGDVVTDDRRRRFLYEAQAASALNHPNIITVHDIVSEHGCDAIAMEYVTGRTLDRVIPPKGLPITDVLRFALDIASGVAAAHGAGIIHRDLKPANVMITDAGRVKVLDFGLAKRVESLDAGNDVTQTQAAMTAEGAIVGTVSYMSPEQAEGRALDARSDVFSFGSLLYEMVVGRRAFHGDTPLSTITAILRDEPPPIAANRLDVPRELERIIARCLRKDPGRRYQTMSDVRLALEELKEDPGSEAVGGSVHEERQRGRWLWISTTAVIVATAVVGGMLWSRRAVAPHAPTLIRPLTNSAGFEGSPAVSPDGKMVAYAWNGTQSDTFDIYVKLLGSPQPLKLTSGPGAKMWPVWSSDGTRIAYTTPVGDVNRQTYEIPALGGSPRRITEGWATDWSPDGHTLLVMRQTHEAAGGVFLIDVVSGGSRRLTTFASGRLQDSARFSADGKSVFFTEMESADRSRIMRIWIAGGEARPVPIAGLRQADLRTLLPGGRELLLAGLPEGGGSLALFRVPVEGGTPIALQYGQAAARPGLAALVRAGVGAARVAPTLAFVEFRSNVNVWRVAAWPGSDRTPERWIASAREEFSAAASPDGSRLAVASTRSGVAQIWVMDADGRNGRNVTSLVGGIVGSPRWSPDGTRISFDARVEGNPDIWVVSQQGGTPRRLTTESAEDVVPDWSPDGQWVYFTSDRTGRQEVWRTPSTGGSAEQVTRGGGFNARLGRDGFVYYLKSRDTGELRRCPAAGGREETLDTRFKSRNFVVLSDGIYGLDGGEASPAGGSPATNVRPGRARFYRFRTRRWEDLGFTTPRTVATNGIEVSPDRQWLYYSQADEHGSAVMLVENFR